MEQLLHDMPARHFHMSGKKVLDSEMTWRNPRVNMGLPGISEFEIYRTDGEQGAVEMLKELSGRTHQVYTGVSLFLIKDGKLTASQSFHVCTDVTMRPMSDREIADYVATGEPMDKAGAYGIQGKAAVFISGIHGDYYNVVGLPVCETVQQLQSLWNRYNS